MLISAVNQPFVDLGKDENNLVLLEICDQLVIDNGLVELQWCQIQLPS